MNVVALDFSIDLLNNRATIEKGYKNVKYVTHTSTTTTCFDGVPGRDRNKSVVNIHIS